MGLKYSLLHSSIHLISILSLIVLFRLSLLESLIPLIGGLIIDLDHFPLLKRHGIRKTYSMLVVYGFGNVRKYGLHNYGTILISLLLSFFVLTSALTLLGIFFLAILFHLLWDLAEDAVIFKVHLNHWKL